MKIVFMALMGLFFATDLFPQEAPVSSTEPSARRRGGAPSSGSEGEEGNYRNGQLFEEIQDCESSDCPCCLYQGQITINDDEPDERVIPHATICSTEHSQMDNVNAEWGPDQMIRVNGQDFRVFNADPSQAAIIQEALSILPPFYLVAVPQNIRIGNPATGGLRTSPTSSMVHVRGRSKPVHQGDLYHETIGGGSRRCQNQNDNYEYIILHPLAFIRQNTENPFRTILHEVGHFVEREYSIASSAITGNESNFQTYLTTYDGDSTGNDEVVASGFCYYFFRKYWNNGIRRETPLTEINISGIYTGVFPRWLRAIIQTDIDSRS